MLRFVCLIADFDERRDSRIDSHRLAEQFPAAFPASFFCRFCCRLRAGALLAELDGGTVLAGSEWWVFG